MTGFTVANRTVEFDIAPTADVLVTIYRVTPTEPLVGWADASVFRSGDMTISQVQQLHIIEESRDWSTLNSIVLGTAGDAWEGRGYRIQNVADPQNPQDVVTKNYMETVQGGFVQQNTTLKDEATKQAGIATTKAGEASASASAAKTFETNAQKWAESPDSPDGTTSKSAKTWANEAVSSASNASLSAQTATTKAEEAKGFASAAESSAQVASGKAEIATTKAGEAITSANNAAQSASAAKQSETNTASSEKNAAQSATAAKQSETNAAQRASDAAASAEEAKQAAGSVGNPVVDVSEDDGTVRVSKGNESSTTFSVLTPSMKDIQNGVAGLDAQGKLSSTVYNFASQKEAEAGVIDNKPMTPKATKQFYDKNIQPNVNNKAPLPISATGLGQWANLLGTSILPDGGMWAYFIFQTTGSGIVGGAGNNYSGVAAGGTQIVTGSQSWCHGFAWRLA